MEKRAAFDLLLTGGDPEEAVRAIPAESDESRIVQQNREAAAVWVGI